MMEFPDALPLALWVSVLALALGVGAWLGDRRRMLRHDPDAVGFMPWATLFVWALMVGTAALAIAGGLWLKGRM